MAIQIVDSIATSNRRLETRSLAGSRSSGSWARPSEWPALPPITSSNQRVVGLIAIFDQADANYVALSATGNYTVDWGDGTTENFSSAATAQRQYNYSNANLTATSYGYKVAVVSITPQSGQNLTSINLNVRHSSQARAILTAWLDVAISLPNANTGASILISSAINNVVLKMLQRVQILNLGNCTNLGSVFRGLQSLESVRLESTASVTGMNNVFSGCTSLKQAPSMNTSAVTDFSYAFDGCSALTSVPAYDLSSVTNFSYAFQSCSALESLPTLSLPSCTSMAFSFQYCYALQSLSFTNTSSCASITFAFSNCQALRAVSGLNTNAVTNANSAFSNCFSLLNLPALNLSSATSSNSFASFAYSLVSSLCTGSRYSIAYNFTSLTKTAIETIFTNLGTAFNTSQTIDIGSVTGADTAISRTGCTTTAGSTTVTLANTASLVTGMICTGTGISTGVSVTFQDSGDTVTLANHGLANGTMISFSAITSTTGIVAYTNYWVINASANTFQVAATQGGAALPLTTNGSGTLLYPAYVTNIVTNTSVTLSAPASASGTVTLTFRRLDVFRATSKGWGVSG